MGVPVRPGTPSHRTGPAGPGRDGRLAPGRSRCERGDMAGAMASAISAVKLLSPHVRAGSGNATRVSPPARNAATKTRAPRTNRRQRPTRRARSARLGRGGRWPGALGPRPGKDQRGAVAGAMASAIAAVKVPSPLRAGLGNASRFPRPRGTVPCRPGGPGDTEASARPGGCKAPATGGAGAGRGLWAPGPS